MFRYLVTAYFITLCIIFIKRLKTCFVNLLNWISSCLCICSESAGFHYDLNSLWPFIVCRLIAGRVCAVFAFSLLKLVHALKNEEKL